MSYLNEVIKIEDGLYAIEELKNIWKYLIVGEKAALLVDTGFGFADNLPEIIRSITALPLTVVNTHGDIDHVCGNYMFDDVYIPVQDFKLLADLNNLDFRRSQLMGRILWPGGRLLEELDLEAMDRWLKRSIWETRYHLLEDGQTFDLGDRIVTAITVPGHTPGSMVFLDSKTGYLYSGDMLIGEVSTFMVGLPQYDRLCEPLPVLYHSLKKLRSCQDEIKVIYPGHGRFGYGPEVIDALMEILRAMYETPEQNQEVSDETATYILDRKKDPNKGFGLTPGSGVGILCAKQNFEKFFPCPLDVE